jgi:hypothetical protein
MDAISYDEILRPRKTKWLLVLLVCMAFVVIGLFMLRDPEAAQMRTWVYVGVTFFALGTFASLVQLIPGSSFLRLTSEGLSVRTLWRTTSYQWTDIARFGVGEFTTTHGPFRQRHRLVGLDFASTYPRHRATQALMTVSRKLTGFEGALPDNYGRSHADLAAYLNRLKARFAGSVGRDAESSSPQGAIVDSRVPQ